MSLIIWDFLNTLYNSKEQKLCKGAEDLLRHLHTKHTQVLISSNLFPEKRKKLVKALGIDIYFDKIIIVKGLKSPRILAKICKQYECKPEETYIIGDSLANEIRGGSRLNMKTIWIKRAPGSTFKEEFLRIKYWKKVSNLSQLSKLISINLKASNSP